MNRLLVALYDRMLAPAEKRYFGGWRQALLKDLTGQVLELGAGTGANLKYYPGTISELVLSEPNRHMRKQLETRARSCTTLDAIPRVIAADAEALPVPDASFDAVVSTLVLCSVNDVDVTLSEARRVLRPGGQLVIMEHIGHERRRALALQHAITPVWKRVCGNCHLARDPVASMRQHGFMFELPPTTYELPATVPLANLVVRGRATRQP